MRIVSADGVLSTCTVKSTVANRLRNHCEAVGPSGKVPPTELSESESYPGQPALPGEQT